MVASFEGVEFVRWQDSSDYVLIAVKGNERYKKPE